MASILEQITARIRQDDARRCAGFDSNTFALTRAVPILPFCPPVAGVFHLIAEVKRASPSKEVIRADFDHLALARDYAAGGASALSVISERHFFQGDPAYVQEIKALTKLPVLRKDFLLHPLHIYESYNLGADAVLLIAACLPGHALADMAACAKKLGLHTLIEVHDEAEMERALAVQPALIGINNRDLNTFVVDLATSLRLKQRIPDTIAAISESGIACHADIIRLQEAGFCGALVGESLLRQRDVKQALELLIHG